MSRTMKISMQETHEPSDGVKCPAASALVTAYHRMRALKSRDDDRETSEVV